MVIKNRKEKGVVNGGKLKCEGSRKAAGSITDAASPRKRNVDKLVYELQMNRAKPEVQNQELRRVQEKLEATQERCPELFDFPVGEFAQSLIDTAQTIVLVLDTSGHIVTINPYMERVSGYKLEEIKGQDWFSTFLPREKQAKTRDLFLRAISGIQTKGNVDEIVTRDGITRTVLWFDITLKDINGNVVGLLSTGQDITEQHMTEKRLQLSEDRYRTLVERAFEGIIVIQDGKIVFANPRAYEIVDYPSDQTAPRAFIDFLYEEDREIVIDRHLRRLKGEQLDEAYPIRLTDQHGNIKWAQITTARIEWEGKPAALTFLTDISEKKKDEEALQESEQKYRTLVTQSPDGIFVVDLKGNFIAVNKSMCEGLRYSEEELLAMNIWDIVPEQYRELHEKRIAEILMGKIPNAAAEYETRGKDGVLHYVEILSAPYYVGKELIGFQGIARNITERKLAEEKLVKSYESLKKTLNDAINTMVKIVETRDPYTAGHQQRVADLAISIAGEMKLEDARIDNLRTAAVIHDIGKMYIPSDILSKPGRLSEIEFSLIKTHPQYGYDIVKGMDFPCSIAKAVLQHHERLDGSGYPNGLKGEDTLLEAKILVVADVVEAITANRPYRPALGIDSALEEISKNRGTLYDPDVVDACLKLFKFDGYEFKSV